MITVKLYGDESADATKSRVFAISGVIGTDAEWDLAIRDWLRCTRGLPFHATDLETQDANHPDPQRHKDNLKLYFDLTQILAKSHLAGWAFALDLRDYYAVFPDQLIGDWAYFKCLSDLIRAATTTARKFNGNPLGTDRIRLEFTFDSRLESNGTAGALYTMMATHPDWRDTGIFDTKIAFDHSVQEPRLEIADLLARESMKELDRQITESPRPKRGSRTALEATGKFHFMERRREHWEALRDYVQSPAGLALQGEFNCWLDRAGKVQNGQRAYNMQNWILFNAWIDNQEALRRKYDDVLSSEVLERPSERPEPAEGQP